MKNSEMMVSKLLAKKKELEEKVSILESALHKFGNMDLVYVNCQLTTCYSDLSRFSIKRELILEPISKQLELTKSELEPVVKKLDAIELMLKS